MEVDMIKIKKIILLGIVLFLISRRAYAYMDPSSSSYYFQLLIAAVISAGFLIKGFVKNIFQLFSKRKNKNANKKS